MKLKVQTIENNRCSCDIYRDRDLNKVKLICIIPFFLKKSIICKDISF